MPVSELNPTNSPAASSRSNDEIVADGESRKRTTAQDGLLLNSQAHPAIQSIASSKFSGNAKNVQKWSIMPLLQNKDKSKYNIFNNFADQI